MSPTINRAARALLLAAPLLLAGCGETRTATTPPRFGGTLVIAAPTDLDFANSLVSVEVYTQELLLNALFLPLLRHDQELEYEPRLARSWELLADTGVVFHLRDDVAWHDGVKTTAYDVAFTYERVRDPETAFANARDFQYWHGVEVIDSFTVRFGFEPHPDPLSVWPSLAIMPRHLLDSIPARLMRQAPFNHAPVGNGPFRFGSNRANDRWVFTANPDFPEELGGRPYLDRLVWLVIPESTSRNTELLTGRADLVIGVPARELLHLAATPEIRTLVRPSRKYQALIWNGSRKGLDDPRVRRALALAINRPEILQVMRGGYGELATGPIYPAHWAFDSTLTPLPYDPAAARALLADAGYRARQGNGRVEDPLGRPLEVELLIPTGNEYNRNIATMVQAHLAAIGVRVRPRLLDFATLAAVITAPERDFDAVFLSWESGFRLELGDLFHSAALDGPFQFASYRNPEVDRLLDLASRADRTTALPLWHRLQTVLQEEQPWTIFFYTPDLFAYRAELQGISMDIRGALTGVAGWWKAGAAGAPVAAAALGATPAPRSGAAPTHPPAQ
jgi:peptide/nickel transport system substrate-binding protein